MNNRFSLLVLAMLTSSLVLSGCSLKNEASKAAAESEETEKEGSGEAAAEEAAKETEKEAEPEEEEKIPERVYMFMPGSRTDRRWSGDASVIRSALREEGYRVFTEYAGDDPSNQKGQISNAILEETVAMIVAPVDPYSLSDVLEEADEAGIRVFDYDELIMDTNAIDFFITFDDREAGHMMADKAAEAFDLDKYKEGDESHKIRILSGNQENISDLFAYNGVKEQLQQYYESGALIDAEDEEVPDIFILADGKAAASERDRYDDAEELYVIACDNSAETVQKVVDGSIDAVLIRDSRDLAKLCADTVITRLSGDDPEVSNYEEYDNGLKLIKAATCTPQIVDGTSWQLLFDDGFFAPGEIAVPSAETEEGAEEEVTTQETAENE